MMTRRQKEKLTAKFKAGDKVIYHGVDWNWRGWTSLNDPDFRLINGEVYTICHADDEMVFISQHGRTIIVRKDLVELDEQAVHGEHCDIVKIEPPEEEKINIFVRDDLGRRYKRIPEFDPDLVAWRNWIKSKKHDIAKEIDTPSIRSIIIILAFWFLYVLLIAWAVYCE